MTNPVFVQQSFRGRNDDGGETDASWIADANIDFNQVAGTPFRLRFLIQETNNKSATNQQYKAQYNKLSAGWVDVTTSSSNVISIGSANTSWTLTDDDATTQQVGGGTFFTGAFNDDDVAGEGNQLNFAGNDETELEFCLQIVDADVALGNTIQVRVVESDSTLLDTYSNTPTITVDKRQTQTIILDAALRAEGTTQTFILQAKVGTFREVKIMANLTKAGGGGSVTLMRGRGWHLPRPPLDVPIGLNPESPQAKGLVGWWPTIASRGSRVLRDLSGHGFDGDFGAGVRSPLWTSADIPGAILDLGNGDDPREVVVPHHPDLDFASGNQDFSVFVWVKLNVLGVFGSIMSKEDADNDGYRFRIRSSDLLQFSINAIDIGGDTALVAGRWYHAGCVINRIGDGILYLNGIQDSGGDAVSGEALSTTSNLHFGTRSHDGVSEIDADMGEIRIYNRALSADQVWQLYEPSTRWDLYRPLRPRFVLSPVAAVEAAEAATQTTIIDAVLKAEGQTQNTILDAVLKAEGETRTAILDTILKATATRTFVLDAILKAEGTTQTAVIDAVLKAEGQTQTAVIDAVLKAEGQTRTATLDAILKAEGQTQTFVLQANLSGSRTFVLDAVLKAEGQTQTVVLDAVLKAEGQTRTAVIDAILKAEGQTQTATLDAVLKAEGQTQTAVLDAVLKSTATQTVVLDAVLKAESETRTATLDAILKAEGQTRTTTLDAILKAEGQTRAATLDAILKAEGQTRAATLDAILKAEGQTRTTTLDAILKAEGQTRTATLDAILKAEGQTQTAVIDAILKATATRTAVIDAVLKATATRTAVIDAVLEATATATRTTIIDAVLRAEGQTQTFVLDAVLSGGVVAGVIVLKGEVLLTTSLEGEMLLTTSLKGEVSLTTSLKGEV